MSLHSSNRTALSITQSFNATHANNKPIPTASLSTHSQCYHQRDTPCFFIRASAQAYLVSQTPPDAQCSSSTSVCLSLSFPTCSIRDKAEALCGRVRYGTDRCSSVSAATVRKLPALSPHSKSPIWATHDGGFWYTMLRLGFSSLLGLYDYLMSLNISNIFITADPKWFQNHFSYLSLICRGYFKRSAKIKVHNKRSYCLKKETTNSELLKQVPGNSSLTSCTNTHRL